MKHTLLPALIVTVAVLFVLPAVGADLPEQKLQTHHIVLVREGPNWKSQGLEQGMAVRTKVIDGIRKQADSGLVVSADLVDDETDAEFIVIMNDETKTEAYGPRMQAPNAKNGFFTPVIYFCCGPKGLAFQR